ncbi:MAG: 4-alpha-glucanotransferase [Elusimicrobiota bacterium]
MEKALTLRQRASGVLLHPTSLPGPHGIGDLGPEAFRFAEVLAACGQTWWQMLPISPIGAGNSPYASPSAFAGNPLLLSLERLREDGLLEASDLRGGRGLRQGQVNYPAVARFKEARLRKAFAAFEARGGEQDPAFAAFCAEQAFWLPDYALFCALKETQQGAAWVDWLPELRSRRPEALERACRELAGAIAYHRFLQFEFDRQWKALRRHCAALGVGLIGDIPIFVAHDSSDVWARPELWLLGADGKPEVVAGVPPDYFSVLGQLWGNPLYRWDKHKEEGYSWWLDRFRGVFERFSAVRIDHFIGFQNYWEIPGGAQDARSGRWMPGPSHGFFEKVQSAFGAPEIIAEDLGVVTPEVAALRDRFDFPGMRLVQFSFSAWDEAMQPHRYPRRCVVYTGTHDNDTSVGWFSDPGGRASTRTPEQIQVERDNALRYMGGTDGREIHWDMIRQALKCPADTVIIPMQDLLGLDSGSRMNMPGTPTGNWQWRMLPGQWGPEVAGRLSLMTGAYDRSPGKWTT